MLTRPMLNIRILFTNYDIITDFLNLAFCSEHFISIKHRILATFNINKKFNYDILCAFKYYTIIVCTFNLFSYGIFLSYTILYHSCNKGIFFYANTSISYIKHVMSQPITLKKNISQVLLLAPPNIGAHSLYIRASLSCTKFTIYICHLKSRNVIMCLVFGNLHTLYW